MNIFLASALAILVGAQSVLLADDNKEKDTVFGVSVEKEKLEIAIALSEATAAFLLGPGKGKPVVSKSSLTELSKSRDALKSAQALVSDVRKAELLADNLSKVTKVSDGLKDLSKNVVENAKEIAAQGRHLEELKSQRKLIEETQVVTKAIRDTKIKEASQALRDSADKIIDASSKARSIAKSGKVWKTIKFGARTYALADLGIKGYCWVVLETDPGYSPAAAVVYTGGRNLYNKAKDAVSGAKATHK